MALVPVDNEEYDQLSIAPSNASHMRAANATEHAKRRLKAVVDQKDRQCEQMRQTLERKKRQLEEERKEVEQLCQLKDEMEVKIRELRETKVVYRMFKKLDLDKKDAVSLDNVQKATGCNDDERLFVEESLFKVIPRTFHFTFRCRDLSEDEVKQLVTSSTGVSVHAVEVLLGDAQTHGICKVSVRLAWHSHPVYMAEDPSLPEDENERRREELAEYYTSLGGEGTCVEPEAARETESRMVEEVKANAKSMLGWEVVRVTDDLRAIFDDFATHFWFQQTEMPVEALQLMYAEAKRTEEETILPEEALDKVVELEHAVKHQQKLNSETLRDTALTEKDIQTVDKRIDAVSRELQHIQRVTGFDSAHSNKDHIDFSLQEEEIAQLQQLVRRLEEEHRVGTARLSKKTQLLVTLSEEVEEKAEIEEQVFKAMNDLKVTDREVGELQEQLRLLRLDHMKTDRAITALEGRRDLGAVQSLNSDKVYLQSQIGQHKNAKREADRTIKAQAHRLAQLENRLSVVTAALKDLKTNNKIQRRLKDALMNAEVEDADIDPYNIDNYLPAREVVDVELYELLQRDLEAITTSMKLKDIILLEKEATIEATELKLDELRKEKEDDEEYFQHASHKDVKEVESLREQHRIRQETQRRERDTIKRGLRDSRKTALTHSKEG
eukprot:TRINITY_DN2830_c0_g1_i3.p1 TRINITY_DN2830_c0_g1~~TRINITY_DN2830_c0_g1_i3.p1  ORF type:complete len:667 (+),score=388.64 TRINITY_DN2830_c0_g1_i3:72-2072(+)